LNASRYAATVCGLTFFCCISLSMKNRCSNVANTDGSVSSVMMSTAIKKGKKTAILRIGARRLVAAAANIFSSKKRTGDG
jgi:hypothetical protein